MIDAIIDRVEYLKSGSARLYLEANGFNGPGQSTLLLTNPPPKHLHAAIGVRIRGDKDWIYIGETCWAKRHGHTRIELVPRKEVYHGEAERGAEAVPA